MSRVTQAEIARHLGISRSAVATVLSNASSSRISPDLRERILGAAKELGYVPNRFAQTMSTGRSGMIGVINFASYEPLPQIKVVEAVRRILKEGYAPMVDNALWFADQGRAICARMIQMQVEGVALVHSPPSFTSEHLKMLLDAKIPVVGLGGGQPGITRFLADKEEGFHLLTRHLIDAGYRRLTLLVGPPMEDGKHSSWHAVNARAGFLRALEEGKSCGVFGDIETCCKPKKEQEVESLHLPYHPGYLGMLEILKRPIRPEVVLCSNDHWACGALAACSEAGIKVPEEIAITGFENDPASQYGLLPLTTVAHPISAMVEQGLAVLFEAIRTSKPTPDQAIVLPGELVIRKSCGADLRKRLSDPKPRRRGSARRDRGSCVP